MSRQRLHATLLVLALSALGLWAIAGCSKDAPAPTAPGATLTAVRALTARDPGLARAIAVQQRHTSGLLDSPGVVGTGVGTDAAGRPVVRVFLEGAGVAGIPAALDGLPVERVVTGRFQPFALTGTYRPVPIGVSAGNANQCVPGTICCVLTVGNNDYLLSANHVFARQNQAALGEAIVQPSPPDIDPSCGPAPSSAKVAKLSDFQTVVYDGKTPNTMDAAIADLTTNNFTCATLPQFYGFPSSAVAAPASGLAVMKVGRTTELTTGTIKSINVSVKITFPSGTALFVGQMITSPGFGAFGDSGSLVVTNDGADQPVGMLIGGSNNGSAIVTPMGPILARFNATICSR